jgi:hypothetical protein
MIGFIDTLYTVVGTRLNYRAIADLHTLRFTVTYALGFSLFTGRIPATDLSQSHCHFKSHMECSLSLQITYRVFFSQPNSFLTIFSSITFECHLEKSTQFNAKLIAQQAGVSKLDSTRLPFCYAEHFLITTLHRPTENTAPIVKEVCLLIRCLAIDVLLFSEFACAGMCLPSRCLAMGIHVTLYIYIYIYIYMCVSI